MNVEMLIMNESVIYCKTTYDEDACRAIVHLMLGKLRRWPRFVLIALGLLTATGMGMLMIMQGRVSAPAFLMMILGSMLCTVGFFLEETSSRMLMASYGKAYPQFEYEFSEAEIRIVYADRDVRYSYAYVLRLLEMSGYLFIFMKDGQVYILRQSDVRVGYEQLRMLLNAKCKYTAARKGVRR